MGTDVYLEWDKMSQKEKKKQITGFDIAKGNAGYLRASIGMQNENVALRMLFPSGFWQGEPAMKYDFVGNFKLMEKVLKSYADGKLDAEMLPDTHQINQMNVMNQAIRKLIKGMDGKIADSDDTEDIRFKMVWAKSVIQFFLLGKMMQKAKRNPKVYISW